MTISLSDIGQHFVKFGIDVFPVITVAENRTRLNVFFEKGSAEHPDVFSRVLSGEREFRVSKRFVLPSGGNIEVATFDMTARGPVFSLPLKLHDVPATGFAANYFEKLSALRELFFQAFPELKKLRFGVVREAVFDTGADSCISVLGGPESFCNAQLAGGDVNLIFQDAQCNINIKLQAVRSARIAQLAVGPQLEATGHGLSVQLDVNNKEIKPLESADLEVIVERAESLWPQPIIDLITQRGGL